MSHDVRISLLDGRRIAQLLEVIIHLVAAFIAWSRSAVHAVLRRLMRLRAPMYRWRIGLGLNMLRECSSARSPSATSLAAGCGSGTRNARSVRREPRFTTVRVEPDFGPRDHASTFAALQRMSPGQLLDLVPVRLLRADLFTQLAAAWTASPVIVPRMAILLSFERWVSLRETALAALQPLAARGVRVEVFYAEQASAGHLAEWFAHGRVVHNVRAAIATLVVHWQPSASWPMVIDTLARLARAYTPTRELPELLTQIAALALSCGGAVEAATLAREALYYLPETPSATRSQALRELGTALICQDQTSAGLAFLDRAFTMAASAKAPDIGASALCHSGLCALNHGDYSGAARRFRRAIELLSPPICRPHLLALAHHSLAVALMHQGRPGAEHHARTALALRPDPRSHLAEEDRLLLAKLREVRVDSLSPERCGESSEPDQITTDSPPEPVPLSSEKET
jgi:Flp pilus assembly protein TadD